MRCFRWLVSLLHITLSIADDNVENSKNEWLGRRTVNPLGSARVGSNLIFVVFLFGSLVNWIAICSLNSAIKVQISEKNCYT